MSNHYHLLVEELQKNGISKFMHKLGTGYTMYFNKKYNHAGSLFQGTFKAVVVDRESQLDYLLVYINVINPGQFLEPNLKKEGIKNQEGIMDFAKSYLWSTNKEYLYARDSIIIDKGILGQVFPDSQSYEELVKAVLADKSKLDDIANIFLEE